MHIWGNIHLSNIYSVDFTASEYGEFSADQPVRIGIPFVMYVAGGVLHLNAFLWSGLFGNLIVVIAVGFGLGLVFRLIERRSFLIRIVYM